MKDDAGGDAQPSHGTPPSETKEGRNAEVDFHRETRSNATHASTTDADARLYRKARGREAKLCYLGHALIENRNGLIVDACVTRADGHAERNAARAMNVTSHVTQNLSGRRSAIDGSATRHAGYKMSLRIRERIEEAWGWGKEVGCAGPGSRACHASAYAPPSPPQPTTSCACQS